MIRKVHKYIGLLVSLQLLAWTVSGTYFAFKNIDTIRGTPYRQAAEFHSFELSKFNNSYLAKELHMIFRLGEPVMVVQDENDTIYFDAAGKPVAEITGQQAVEIVNKKTNLTPLEAIRIDKDYPGSEFRGRELPLYKVTTDSSDNVNVYLNAMSGEVTAIRSESWRIWDFLWGLHIMDYVDRDDFHNIWLKIFSVLAIVTSLSGIVLFVISSAWWSRRRSKL